MTTVACKMIRRLAVMSATGAMSFGALLGSVPMVANAAGPTPITIAQIPLTVAIPAHPQVLLAVTDAQSMDGNLSGAIMTGSGSLKITGAASLGASSSLTNYTIPAGFTPPLNPGAGGVAPYTVSCGANLCDNSPSRLNVAKAGIAAILQTYMEDADFALMDYSTSGLGAYSTFVYEMSPTGSGFTFTNAPGVNRYVANPCYNANTALTDSYSKSCLAMLTHYGVGSGVIADQYMIISSSSDDPLINDVLYAPNGYEGPICVAGSPSPTNVYTHFTLANYNSGAVVENYGSRWGPAGYSTTCVGGMYPTNAAYVPYTPEVMLIQRGWAYDAGTQSATTGNLVVAMQSSGAAPTQASVNTAIAAFTPYLKPETNSTGTTEIKAVGEQSPTAGLVQGAKNYFVNTNPASSNGCAATRYIVLVTDGLPTKDLNGLSWPPLGSVSATGWNVTATFNADGSLNTTNDQALRDAVNQITTAKNAGIKTYVIGLGAGVDPSNNPSAASTLTAMAVAGGTGAYFPATSPSNLTNAMQVILA